MTADLTKQLRCWFANAWVTALKQAFNFLLPGWRAQGWCLMEGLECWQSRQIRTMKFLAWGSRVQHGLAESHSFPSAELELKHVDCLTKQRGCRLEGRILKLLRCLVFGENGKVSWSILRVSSSKGMVILNWVFLETWFSEMTVNFSQNTQIIFKLCLTLFLYMVDNIYIELWA